MAGGGRLFQIAIGFVLAAAGIAWHLFDLQVLQTAFWEREAALAITREQVLPCQRGEIRDCWGRPLAASRTAFDLELVFNELRHRTAAGQLLASHWLLTGRRVALADVFARPAALLDSFATASIGELKAIEPGVRRYDLLVYAGWLTDTTTKELTERLRSGIPTELFCPELGEERAAILAKVRGEQALIAQLERALALEPGALVARIDEAVRAIDERVEKLAARHPSPGRAFENEREFHKDEDARGRLLLKNVPYTAVFDLASDPDLLGGLRVVERTRRIYPEENDVCPILVGRVGPPSDDALKAVDKKLDDLRDLALGENVSAEDAVALANLQRELLEECVLPEEEVGQEGLEAAYERVLRGRRGSKKTVNDRAGAEQEVLEQQPPVGGRDVVLTLDTALQRAAERALAVGVPEEKGGAATVHPGAFVLIELPEMKIRVLASTPSPTRATIAADYEKLVDPRTREGQDHPLRSRAWKPALPPPPGSSIKPLVSAMALSAGLITPHSTYECNKTDLRASDGGPPVRCEGNHGSVDLREALVKSCNHYYAQLAQHVGWDLMEAWMHDFGFGRRTGFASAELPDGTKLRGLGDEAAGIAEHERGGRNLMLFGIGQGRFDATPLQVAAALGALAMRAYRPPTIIDKVGDAAPLRAESIALPIDDAAWRAVVSAMREVTHPGGTASPTHGYDLTPFDLATKTGTPEQGRKEWPCHSWFVGFFPSHAPRYAFAVFLERTGRHGGEAAAPVLARVFEDPAFAEIAAAARVGGAAAPATKADEAGEAR
jgi:cell division protein FtsI/penicillin-binding protein 2